MRPRLALLTIVALLLLLAPSAQAAPDLAKTYADVSGDVRYQSGSRSSEAAPGFPGVDILELATSTEAGRLVMRIRTAGDVPPEFSASGYLYYGQEPWQFLSVNGKREEGVVKTEGRWGDVAEEEPRSFPVQLVLEENSFVLSIQQAEFPADAGCFEAGAHVITWDDRYQPVGDSAGFDAIAMAFDARCAPQEPGADGAEGVEDRGTDDADLTDAEAAAASGPSGDGTPQRDTPGPALVLGLLGGSAAAWSRRRRTW